MWRLLAVVVLVRSAAANPLEVVGLTSRHAAQASAGVASVDDAAALYYNPAGIAHPGRELELGTIGAYAHLERTGRLADPFGVQIAMRAPLPLRGPLADRIFVGMALHLLPGDVARVIAPSPDDVYYPYYGDRMSRIVVLPGIAARFDRLSVGASVDVLAGLGGTLTAAEGATRAIDASADERVPTIARAIVGVTWRVTPCVRAGAVYRQRFEMPISTRVATVVAGEPIDLDIATAGQFAPHQVVGGVAWSRGPHVVSVDARYARWSDYRGPFVRVASVLPLVGDVPALSPRVPFSDTLGGRAGIESHAFGLVLRGGYGFETSPVPARQTGVTNLLDGPRHTVAAGAGRAFGRIRVDAHVQATLVGKRTFEKQLDNGLEPYDPFTTLRDEDRDTPGLQITNPGFPSISGGGQVLSGGVTLAVTL